MKCGNMDKGNLQDAGKRWPSSQLSALCVSRREHHGGAGANASAHRSSHKTGGDNNAATMISMSTTMIMAAVDSEPGTCAASGSSITLLNVFLAIFALPTLIWLTAYLIPQLYMAFRPVPDLKRKYNAKWALVTGGGSGIGKAIAFKLASQGLNVVLVSLDDDFLKSTMKQLQETYPDLEFRSVGCAFSPGVKYMDQIKKATKDIDIPIVFNNAGFIVTGFMDQTPVEKILSNIECNATACVNISHYFVQKMVASKSKGCIVFTSSVAGFIPTPFAASYASTKAFVSQLACCMNIEVANLGIDVCAVHPSPVASNFYDKVDHKIELMEAAQKSAVPPDALPNDIFRSIGVCALRDLGGKRCLLWGM
jgi:short-subunit dehydrogenase